MGNIGCCERDRVVDTIDLPMGGRSRSKNGGSISFQKGDFVQHNQGKFEDCYNLGSILGEGSFG
jgi:hypothetical protein